MVGAVARDLGIEKPLRIVSHVGAFTKPCNCPDPTHKDRSFDGFHTVIDGTHEITVNIRLNPVRLTEVLAHELRHAAQWETGQRARHDNTRPYKDDLREKDADVYAISLIRSGLLLAR
jgi:Zn-dependent peptidase ImmA (M78 family)